MGPRNTRGKFSGYSYHMSVLTAGLPDHTIQTKFQQPSDAETPVPSI
jgi:hypothetical protein